MRTTHFKIVLYIRAIEKGQKVTISTNFHKSCVNSTKKRPSAPMQTAAFGFMLYSICQSLKILSSSLSMVPALANSSVSA